MVLSDSDICPPLSKIYLTTGFGSSNTFPHIFSNTSLLIPQVRPHLALKSCPESSEVSGGSSVQAVVDKAVSEAT